MKNNTPINSRPASLSREERNSTINAVETKTGSSTDEVPPQASVPRPPHDLIKLAMIAIHQRLRREQFSARMLLQIHDELIFEAPAEELPRLAALVREEMVGAARLRVPLKVDLETGPNWADTKPCE